MQRKYYLYDRTISVPENNIDLLAQPYICTQVIVSHVLHCTAGLYSLPFFAFFL